MSTVFLFSALGIKSQLKNVRFLNKLGLGGYRIRVNSPHITIASREFNLSSVSLRRRDRRDPRLKDFDFGAGQPSYDEAFVSSSQSLPGPTGPSPWSTGHDAANFNRKIQRFRNSWDLLEFVGTCHPEQLSPGSLELVFTTLFQCLKNENSSCTEKKRVLASVEMQKLCRAIQNHCHSSNAFPEDLIPVCKLFVYLKTPGNHPTFQIVLSRILKNVNCLSLRNVLYLNFVIDVMGKESKSPVSEALTRSLPITFKRELSMLNDNNLWELIDSLRFAAKNNFSESIQKQILDAIVKNKNKLGYLQAQNVVWALHNCRLIHLPEIAELLETSFKILTSNINSLDMKRLSRLLRFCAYSSRDPIWDCFYNEDFTEAACYRLIEAHQNEDLQLVLFCYKYISIARHVNIDLIETVADLIASNPKAFLHDDSAFHVIIKELARASSSYKPQNWESLKLLLLEPLAFSKESSVQDVVLTLDFLVLDVLPIKLLHRIFSPDCYSTLDRWLKKNGPRTLIMIYNAVKNFHPEYSGPMPPSSMVEHWRIMHATAKEKEESKKHLLKEALQTALGGESYVMSGIVHEGIYIDHCVVMRQGGSPIAVQDRNPMNLEHIERPDNSFLLLIKVFEREAYSRNTRRLIGFHSWESKILASFGHSVLVVDGWGWMQLTDSEKIPWLKKQIRKHVDQPPASSS